MDSNFKFENAHSKRMTARAERNKEILDLVKTKCEKHNGACDIGDGFVIVNTRHYLVRPR